MLQRRKPFKEKLEKLFILGALNSACITALK